MAQKESLDKFSMKPHRSTHKAVKVTFSPATGFPRLLEDMVLVSKVDHLTRAKIREIMDEAK